MIVFSTRLITGSEYWWLSLVRGKAASESQRYNSQSIFFSFFLKNNSLNRNHNVLHMRPHLSPFESSKWIVIHAKETKIQFNEMCLCVLNLV